MKINNLENCEIVCVIDKSGSMGAMYETAISGFNEFLAEQKKLPDPANLTLILFNHEINTVYDAVPISDVQPLTPEVYVTEGMTALNDAVAAAISKTQNRLTDENRADKTKVMVVVLTDGAENSSKEYRDVKLLKSLIEQKKNYSNWEFLYLSSDPTAGQYSNLIGLQDSYFAFQPSTDGLADTYRSMTVGVSNFRSKRI